ncbi:MAG TPA: acyl-CoA reductase [Bacteroidia bacterium]|jgi:hypothetical protein|nr:acyl-CoA reductase [Bacteroidia bacterium]
MTLQDRINAMKKVSEELLQLCASSPRTQSGNVLASLARTFHPFNPWFTEEMILDRLEKIAEALKEENISKWLSKYPITEHGPKKIAVILAGNIPLAGFDDLLCVLMSGNIFIGKLSSDDKKLFPAFAEVICEVEPRFRERIIFTEGRMSGMDAVIATGSNNSGRYFEHYFSKYPHIIRRNRNGVAVLDGKETDEELKKLSEDIFLYFGAGCRSISKMFVPADFNFDRFFNSIFHWYDRLNTNNRYMNNYEYNRTVYLLNSAKLLDNNFLLLKEDIGIASPPGVLYYEKYSSDDELNRKLRTDKELIQCIVSHKETIPGAVPFGSAQKTMPWDYADGIDTLQFLLSIQ